VPEGDTIHRIAAALRREIGGRVLDRLELDDTGDVPQLSGARIERIEAVGKHMLVHVDGGWTLRVHLGMHGSWRKFHAREKLPARATVVMVVGESAYVCTRAYRAEFVKTAALRAHPRLARLGPDLLEDPPRIADAVERASIAANAGREIADLLLDQRVASGIGNVYKSEVLFDRRIHPRKKVGSFDRAALEDVFDAAARLMRLNLTTRRRTSVPLRRRPQPGSRRLFVYGRAGKPCIECDTPIERFLQGDMARSTYFCPSCQAM
jgi:endonuclease-8